MHTYTYVYIRFIYYVYVFIYYLHVACVEGVCRNRLAAAVCCSVLQCVAVCCSVMQCVAVCCSVLQWQQNRCSDSYILSALCVSSTIFTLHSSSESIRVSAALLYTMLQCVAVATESLLRLLYTICTLRLLRSLSSCSRFYYSFSVVGGGAGNQRVCVFIRVPWH